MEKILKLIKEYSKEGHSNYLKNIQKFDSLELTRIYSSQWENDIDKIPYFSLTYLADAYYMYPNRMDIGFFFLWQCINNIYNELLLTDANCKKLSDTKGIEIFTKQLINKKSELVQFDNKSYSLETIVQNYIDLCPIKILKFASNNILKNYAIENSNIIAKEKYLSSSYNTLKKKNLALFKILTDSYGKAYLNISQPALISNDKIVSFNISNGEKSRKISYSLASDLQKLLKGEEVEITNQITSNKIKFTFEERLDFIIRDIIYSIRCNLFHANIASRFNSVYVNNDSIIASKFIYLFSHLLVNLGFYFNSNITINDLYPSIKNFDLLTETSA